MQVIEIENLIKGDMVPVNIEGGYNNDLMIVERVSIDHIETEVSGFLLWRNCRMSITAPAFTKANVWNT